MTDFEKLEKMPISELKKIKEIEAENYQKEKQERYQLIASIMYYRHETERLRIENAK